MSRVRLAVIGLGGIAQSVHLPLIQRSRADIELAALVELSPSRLASLADAYGVPAEGRFTTLAALIEAIGNGVHIDAAIVATGGGHTDEALALISAGVHVLAEKPLGWSADDLDALESGLRHAGRDPEQWLRIGYMKEHDPAVAAAAEALTGVTPREVRIEVLHPADDAQLAFARLLPPADDSDDTALASMAARSSRSVDEALGDADRDARRLWTNVMLGSVIHDIALTRHLGFGLDTVHYARRLGATFPGSVIAAGSTAHDVPWNLSWHFISDYPEYRERVTIHHERGTVELQFATPYILNAPTILRVRSGGPQLMSLVSEQTWPQEEAFERELGLLLRMTSGGQVPGSSIREARRDLASAQSLWTACASA